MEKPCRFGDVFGRHIAAFAAISLADVVAATDEPGWARDLEAMMAELLAEVE